MPLKGPLKKEQGFLSNNPVFPHHFPLNNLNQKGQEPFYKGLKIIGLFGGFPRRASTCLTLFKAFQGFLRQFKAFLCFLRLFKVF